MIPNDILNFEDCKQCKKCCKFDVDELIDSPTLLPEQSQKIINLFGREKLQTRGNLFQVILEKMPLSSKWICPFYNQKNAVCMIHEYNIIDCISWPYYLMTFGGKIYLTLSLDCPVVLSKPLQRILDVGRNEIAPLLREMAILYPDLITPFHGNTIVLYEISI